MAITWRIGWARIALLMGAAGLLAVAACGSQANGAADTIVVLNHPPIITGLDFAGGKFILACEAADLTVTAEDADSDTLTATWAITSTPTGSAAQLVQSGRTAHFTADVPGEYTLEVTIDDGMGAHASLTVPIHVDSGDCFLPDAPRL